MQDFSKQQLAKYLAKKKKILLCWHLIAAGFDALPLLLIVSKVIEACKPV